jgi:molybdopterin-guanine dinucleotide biosynthesis protein A
MISHRDFASGSSIAAVILAGGLGERLGHVSKAQIRIGGRRLIEWVAGSLGDDVDAIIVSVGREDPARFAHDPAWITIQDLGPTNIGPIGGLAAAISWCLQQPSPPDFLLSVAVDTPFFPDDFVAHALTAATNETDAVIAAYDGQSYPTNALWRLASIADLPQRVEAGTAPSSPKRLATELRSVTIDWSPLAGGDPFANLNTIADLVALGRRAKAAASKP